MVDSGDDSGRAAGATDAKLERTGLSGEYYGVEVIVGLAITGRFPISYIALIEVACCIE